MAWIKLIILYNQKGWKSDMPSILILGAKSDIARAVAQQYAKNGYDVILAARNSVQLSKFAKDLNIRTSKDINCVDFDVLALSEHESFYKGLPQNPDVVFSAVGLLQDQTLANEDNAVLLNLINTNFTGVASILNVVAADFEQKTAGVIIGVSSVAGDRGRQSNYAYGAAKAGLTAYLSGMRNRLDSKGVSVITVKPGFVATSMTKDLDLPDKLTATPEQVAKDIYKAHQKGKSVIYTRWYWRWIMFIIKKIPENIFVAKSCKILNVKFKKSKNEFFINEHQNNDIR